MRHGPGRTVISKTPVSTACLECYDLSVQIYAPQKKPWSEIEAQLQTPAGRQSWDEMRARQAGKATRFPKQAVAEKTRLGIRYEAAFIPKPLAELRKQYPRADLAAVAGLHVQSIRNERNENVEVVLLRSGLDRVILYSETEAEYTEHALQPGGQLRASQGLEHFQALLKKTLLHRPRADVPSEDELAAMLGSRSEHARARPDPSGAAPTIDAMDIDFVDDDDFEGQAADATRTSSSSVVPAAPELLLPRGDRRRKSTADRAAGDRASGDARKSKKPRGSPVEDHGRQKCSDADVPLTVENVLRGLVAKPKVAVYHEELRLPTLKKDMSDLQARVKDAELTALRAAVQLVPQELRSIAEEDLRKALGVVLSHIGADRLPLETARGLVRRAAVSKLASPADFWEAAWPWGSSAISRAPAVSFDPARPRLQDVLPKCGDSASACTPAELTAWAARLVAEDGLASFMAQREFGKIAELAELATHTHCTDEASKEHAAELKVLCIGVAALVQTTAVDSAQIQALMSIRNESSALIRALSPLFHDNFWSDKGKQVWRLVAGESRSAPLLEKTCRGLAGGPEEVDEAWAMMTAKLGNWTDSVRPGATKPVVEAAAASVRKFVTELATAAHTTEHQQTAEAWRSRATWLLQQAAAQSMSVEEPLGALQTWLQASSASIKLSEGLAMLPALSQTSLRKPWQPVSRHSKPAAASAATSTQRRWCLMLFGALQAWSRPIPLPR